MLQLSPTRLEHATFQLLGGSILPDQPPYFRAQKYVCFVWLLVQAGVLNKEEDKVLAEPFWGLFSLLALIICFNSGTANSHCN